MKLKLKKNILLVLSILNTLMCCIYLCKSLSGDFTIYSVLLHIGFIVLSILPILCIKFIKRFNHLYYLIPFYSLLSFLGVSITTYMFSIIGIVVCFITSTEEKGILVKILKRHPVLMSLIIVFSVVSFVSLESIFVFFSKLTYGFSMLGELFATVFLFFLIFVCGKEYLISNNDFSLKESIFVSLPFLIYSLYLGLNLFGMHFISGYEFVSIENIVVIVVLYLLVGIFEDFLTRGLVLNILLDKFSKTKKGIWLSIFLSSLFFGLAHFVNIVTGASLQGVLIQVITATCIGMYFSAIYLRSGSVWVPALLHGFYDVAVSVSSFFVVKEVVDVSGDYGEVISNYSWANVIVGVVFILLTLFLLRKNKFNSICYKTNKIETNQKKINNNLTSYVLIGIGVCISLFFCITSFTSLFQLKDYAYDFYDSMPNNMVSQLYSYESISYDSLSDKDKLVIAFSNIDKISDAEKNVSSKELITYIEDYEIEKSLKNIFNKKDVNFIDFNYSNKSTCSYESDLQRYKCITVNNESINNLRFYYNVEKVVLDGESTVELNVYYLVEDINTKTLYADSKLEVVYRYNTLVEDISDGVKYNSSNDNKEFWANIKSNNDGMVPVYKIKLDLNSLGTGLYFVGSELYYSSIEKDIEKDGSKYKTNDFSIKLDRDFKIKEINNYVDINYKNNSILKIEKVSGNIWFNKYNDLNTIEVNLGNYTYYNNLNDYLIYIDDFYIISINTSDLELKNKLLEIISSIEFS